MAKVDKYRGSHELQSRNEDAVGGSDRNFGLVFSAVTGLISAASFWKGGHYPWQWLSASLAFAAVALVMPRVLAPLNWVWTKFGLLLFHVISPLVMGVIFYLVVTPIGVTMRLLGKDLLNLKRQPSAASYWFERIPPGPEAGSMKNQF